MKAGPTSILFAGAVPEVLGSIGTDVVVPAAVTAENVNEASASWTFTLLPVLVAAFVVVGKAMSMIGWNSI